MKALPLTLGFLALIILASLAYDRFVLHPVGRYQHFGSGMARIDTVTGRVDVWHGPGEWHVEISPTTNRGQDVQAPAGWVELGK